MWARTVQWEGEQHLLFHCRNGMAEQRKEEEAMEPEDVNGNQIAWLGMK